MVLGRRRNSKNLDQAVTGDASENASAAVLSQLRSMKTKSSLQGSNVAVVDAEVQVRAWQTYDSHRTVMSRAAPMTAFALCMPVTDHQK